MCAILVLGIGSVSGVLVKDFENALILTESIKKACTDKDRLTGKDIRNLWSIASWRI